jgi:tRNA A37 threonylcarbamoyltransferase TsaD
MIAWTGVERLQRGLIDDYDIEIRSKWPLDSLWPEWEKRVR